MHAGVLPFGVIATGGQRVPYPVCPAAITSTSAAGAHSHRTTADDGTRRQKASPGTRTQPSISTRALRLITALVAVHSPSTSAAAAPTRRVPDG